jgi:TP901 family phage tail tape measure protein
MRTAAAASNGALATAGRSLSAFGKTALVAGGALTAAFGLAISKAAEFEKKMDYFGAVSNATAAQMNQVRDAALELGRTSQYSASQIADAFVEMGKAGVTADQITGGLARAMVNLASAADIDLAQATNIVTSQLQAYSLTAADAAHVTDVLAGAANASIVDVEDLGVSLKYVGGVAHALGISFDSTVDALSLLGKAGIKGSTAGTSLRQIMVSLAGGTKAAKKELTELGIITEDGTNKFFNADGSARSLAEVFQILQDHTRGLSQEQQLMAFRTIFNNRALAAAEILTKAGAAGFAEMNAEISKTTAADVAAQRMDNLAGDIKKLKGNIDTLLIQAGTPFQAFLRQTVQQITRLVQAFASLSPETQMWIFRIVSVTGALLTLIGVLSVFGGAILKIASGIRIMAGAVTLLTTVMRSLTVATIQQTAAALSNPYVLLAMAIVALIAGLVVLYYKSEAFHNFINAIGRGIATGFMAVVDFFKRLPGYFVEAWNAISSGFKAGVDWIVGAWDTAVNAVEGAISAVVSGVVTAYNSVINFFKALPGWVANAVTSAWTSFVEFLVKLPYYVGFVLGFIIGRIIRFVADASSAFWNWAVSTTTAIVDWFSKLPERLSTFFSELWTDIVNFTTTTFDAFNTWVVNTYNNIVDWFSRLPGRIEQFFIDLYNNSITFWTNFYNSSVEWVSNTYNSIIDWFQRLPGRVVQFFVDMYNGTVILGKQLLHWALNLGSDIYNGIVDWLSKLPEKIGQIVDNAIGALKDAVSGAISAAEDFGRGLWDGFKRGMGIHSPSYIERAMWRVTDVTGTESKRLGQQVRTMQGLAGTIAEDNPARAAAYANTTRIAALTQGLRSQAAALQNAANSLFPMNGQYSLTASYAGASSASGPSATGLESAGSERPIIVNNYNPIAERGSDSASRNLRTLSDMGAF